MMEMFKKEEYVEMRKGSGKKMKEEEKKKENKYIINNLQFNVFFFVSLSSCYPESDIHPSISIHPLPLAWSLKLICCQHISIMQIGICPLCVTVIHPGIHIMPHHPTVLVKFSHPFPFVAAGRQFQG